MASFVDLRSDTVTRPSQAMRQAIASAEVGDDVLGDDPTVLRLQERIAEMFGKAAALFVPSGSMANQVAIRSATEPGDEIIADETVHSYNYEGGGPAALCGCSMRLLNGARGIFTTAQVEAGIRPVNSHFPRTRMVIAENTSNRGGGAVWPVRTIADIGALCRERGLHFHIDGARLMNACVALGVKPTEYARHSDSLSLCFSKGLGAPIGSIIIGSKEFIARCHRFRKQFGGGMRQSGLLAAAALYALDHNIERLHDDHANARHFADRIAGMPGIRLDPKTVESNIVIFEVEERVGGAQAFVDKLHERGVWMFATGPNSIRAVTHLDVSRGQIDQAVGVFQELCGARRPVGAVAAS